MIEDGQPVELSRTPKFSPEFLEQHSPVDDLIQFEVFETPEAQTEWLVAQIKKDLIEDELIPDDIVVINPDPFKTKDAVGGARRTLMQMKINSNLAGVGAGSMSSKRESNGCCERRRQMMMSAERDLCHLL